MSAREASVRCKVLGCSTPFGITDYIGRAPPAGRMGRTSVLNAFRHHGLYRPTAAPPGDPRAGRHVLNAFRHHGLYRMAAVSAVRAAAADCAQRLSASRIISGGMTVKEVPVDRCSTPFGITDYIGYGAEDAQQRARGLVLNAFRHHGLYRWQQEAALAAAGGRHVLNAFRHHGLYRLRRASRRVKYTWVLNAFRHHGLYRGSSCCCCPLSSRRCSTPFGITDYIGRAHSAHVEMNSLLCSTPFGITDYIGPNTDGSGVVVNTAKCSTPFGITDYIGSTP